MRDWVVARVRSGSELDVCSDASIMLGLESYVPQFVRWRKLPKHLAKQRGKSKEMVSSILFPCYIFLRIKSQNCLSAIVGLRDVFGFISTDQGVCLADSKDILALKAREQLGANDDTEQGRRLRAAEQHRAMAEAASIQLMDLTGRTVMLNVGPLAGFSGKVTEHNKLDGTVKFNYNQTALRASTEHLDVVD